MLNKAILIGRLVKDPELRSTQSGISVANFSIAVDRRFQKAGEQRQADFLNIVCYRQTAEFIKKFFTKGQMISIVGSIQNRSWEGQDGKKNYITEIIADEAYFCGSKRESGEGNTSGGNNFADSEHQSDDFVSVDDDDSLPF